jgi:hypothetical protein
MNAQLLKEIRLLLPAWMAAVLLIVAAQSLLWLPKGDASHGIVPIDAGITAMAVALILGLLLLAVSSFGNEFARHTFQMFLGQPIPRGQMWKQKVAVLGGSTVSVWLLFWVAFSLGQEFSLRMGIASLAASLVIVSTGLWATLLFRQIMPAFCFSLLLPAVSVPILWPMVNRSFPGWIFATALLLSVLYAGAALAFARRLFRGAQDLDPWLDDLSLILSRRSGSTRPSASATARRRRGPVWSLTAKESHLQQVNLIGGVVIFSIIGSMALLVAGSENRQVIEAVQILFMLAYLFMPVLAGSVAIAEERKLGVREGQQCLPEPRLRQFGVKLIVTYGTILVLGLMLPVFTNWTVSWISDLALAGEGMAKFLAGYAIVAGTVAIYASSLSRSTIAALAVALLGLLAGFAILMVVESVWRGRPLLMLLGLPVLVIVLGLLSFPNSFAHAVDRRVRRQNLRVLSAAIAAVVLVTSLMYYRTWEYVLPGPSLGEPEPMLSAGASIHTAPDSQRLVVHLPDGRLWVSDHPWNANQPLSFPAYGAFADETDWLHVTTSELDFNAIRKDGSLWRLRTSGTVLSAEPMDDGSRWVDLAAGRFHTLAVREDGTLWGWGRNFRRQLGGEVSTTDRLRTPERLDAESDWVRVFASNDMSATLKKNGSLWHWGYRGYRGFRLFHEPGPWENFPEGNPIALTGDMHLSVALLEDGSLWTFLSFKGGNWQRIGERSDWKSVALRDYGQGYLALGRDGSLGGANLRKHETDRIDHPRHHDQLRGPSQWAAITNNSWEFFGLAADGTWWVWEVPHRSKRSHLLAPSRWPRSLGE